MTRKGDEVIWGHPTEHQNQTQSSNYVSPQSHLPRRPIHIPAISNPIPKQLATRVNTPGCRHEIRAVRRVCSTCNIEGFPTMPLKGVVQESIECREGRAL
ncbi:hypothetical protein Nepgr_004464 [Nepenthes gracilis]|uniref:Uncharacterized protein n=1 Tax=Nepenthes gracilis TaxID=150966 RepID=A0AAD3XFA4_NEPGR|nr:hypothetical protein Nepgr_004464 [Nepenthes gracilis]